MMKKYIQILCLLSLSLLISENSKAQCGVGQVSVSITINTDAYALESFWQLVPHNNACGTGTIGSGGNAAVGCNGGGLQSHNPGGYANNSTNTSSSWCLTDGASYDLISIDDWGDGGTEFIVNMNGYPVATFTSIAATERFTFVAKTPLTYDMGVTKITTPSYIFRGVQQIRGALKSYSTDTITSLTLNYSIDNGPTVASNLTGLNILPFTKYDFIHPTSWTTPDTGVYFLKVWASNLNGHADMDTTNDMASDSVIVFNDIPNLIDQYLYTTPVLTDIATSSNSISVPRDLDFHPDLRRYELWVILMETEALGGKTVTIHNAGQVNQTSQLKQDGNAWHFMSLPTSIAFSDNADFATAPGVYDANHGTGSPFTGPTLWSSDPAIYAQPSGGNGSHLDMLHQSPHSMGICHEKDYTFWVMDGNSGNVVRYDYRTPHQPGGSDHSAGIIWRYPDVTFQADPSYYVPSHCILDKTTNQLYGVDWGGRRVFKLDITTGTPGASLTPTEPVTEYRNYDNPTYSTAIDTGLIQPCGIEVFGNRLLVSDHANGDIRIYGLGGVKPVYLGKIVTGSTGIMGIKVGPDGKIWYVDATANKVVRIDGPVAFPAGIKNTASDNFAINIYPNPSNGKFLIQLPLTEANTEVEISNLLGEKIWVTTVINQNIITVNESLPQGMYLVKAVSGGRTTVRNLVIQ